MRVLNSFYVYGALSICFLPPVRLAVNADNPMIEIIQQRTACFMVNTASKLHRMNIANYEADKNIFFSPMDLYAATALVQLGITDKNTRRRLNRVLGIITREKFEELHPEFFITTTQRRTPSDSYEASAYPSSVEFLKDYTREEYKKSVHTTLGRILYDTCNAKKTATLSGKAIFVDSQYAVGDSFKDNVKEYYDVTVKCADFAKQPRRSTDNMNSYIKNQTYDKIPRFFDEPVHPSTRSVITSSLTLFVNWRKMFQPGDSYETAFHTRDGECDDCDDVDICVMMNQGEIPYYVDSTVSAISLATANPHTSLYYVIPHSNYTLSQIISHPNTKFIQNIIRNLKPKSVVYHIPKMTFRGEVDQLKILKQSAIDDITLEEAASELKVRIFKQKVLLEINEEGVGGCPLKKAKKMPLMHNAVQPDAVQFVADKPFLFFIFNSKTKMFLFYGAVFRPIGYTDF